MQPDVIARGEELPFADGWASTSSSRRLGAHHFGDVRAAVHEMARVAAKMVVIVDNTFGGEGLEEAEQRPRPVARPLLHGRGVAGAVRRRGPADRGDPFAAAARSRSSRGSPGRAATGEEADRVRELAADRIEDGWITLDRIAMKGVKS